MSYFYSLQEGLPIAYLTSKDGDPDIIHLNKEDTATPVGLELKPIDLLAKLVDGKLESGERVKNHVNQKELVTLFDALSMRTPPLNLKLKTLYNRAIELSNERKGKEIRLEDPASFLIPYFDTPEDENNYRLGVFGAAGSGKSHFLNMILRAYIMLHPDALIYVFSKLQNDKSLDKGVENNIVRIPIDNQLLDAPMTSENFEEGSWVVFDDIDRISDPKLMKEVKHIRDMLLEVGRHQRLHIANVSHQFLNYRDTRLIHSEGNYAVVFPGRGNDAQITKMAKTYLSLTKEQITKILALPSRWVLIHRQAPMYVLHERGSYLLT